MATRNPTTARFEGTNDVRRITGIKRRYGRLSVQIESNGRPGTQWWPVLMVSATGKEAIIPRTQSVK